MTHDFSTPWIVNYEYGCQVVTPQYHKAMVIAKTTDTSVATLIAAAPELLGALMDSVAAMERMDAMLLKITGNEKECEKGEITRARAAIAKATGEQA